MHIDFSSSNFYVLTTFTYEYFILQILKVQYIMVLIIIAILSQEFIMAFK